VTLADLLRHEAGLPELDESLNIGDLSPQTIKTNVVGRVIEKQRPRYREGEFNRREYHSFTRGWVVNEIVRRVDPQGRTLGEIIRDDICGPLHVDAFIGLTDAEVPRVFPIENVSTGFMLRQSLLPQSWGRVIEPNFFELLGMASDWVGIIR
jgi:CubicO group peptidase (beta-lactamase class C family)